MEKDNFKDRTIETTLYKEIHVGDFVYICLKAMQPFATEITDLSFGQVTELLTKHDHPRGIKVRIKNFVNPNEDITDESKTIPITKANLVGNDMVGRVAYTTKNGFINRIK